MQNYRFLTVNLILFKKILATGKGNAFLPGDAAELEGFFLFIILLSSILFFQAI
jgi:hypothetical protein